MSQRIVIAGAGHAAGQAVATLRHKCPDCRIVLIGEEEYYPYQRPPLSKKFLAGEMTAERLYVKPAGFYDDAAIDLRLSTQVDAIERGERRVHLATGESLAFDKLILSTGARVRRLSLPGSDLAGIHYLRTIRDVTDIRRDMQPGARIVIIGAGYIGLEVAAVCRQLGLHVTVVEMLGRVMSRVVSEPVSTFYETEHRRRGVDLRLSTGVNGFSGQGRVRRVELSDGYELPADLVLIGIGIVPNADLATAAGLETADGIVVDDRCRTSDPDIYAAGDCTYHPNPIFGRSIRLECVQNAVEQAKTAALNISGEESRYAQVPWFWSDQYDIKLQIAGLSQGYDQVLLRGTPADRAFSCLYLRDGALIAVDAINNPRDFMQSKSLIAGQAVIDAAVLTDVNIAMKDMRY